MPVQNVTLLRIGQSPITVISPPVSRSCGTDCGCCASNAGVTAPDPTSTTTPIPAPEGGSSMSTATYTVTGMTCGHCVAAVTEELRRLDGVTSVEVDLNADGPSRVTVTSGVPLPEDAVRGAVVGV